MNIFTRNSTKWIPLGHYVFDINDFIVFVRKNVKTGEMFFKSKKVSGRRILTRPFFKHELIDIKTQWEVIIKI